MDFIVTGTSVYGPKTNKSDLDIVMYHSDAVQLEQFLFDKEISVFRTEQQQLEQYGGFYFNLFNIEINIIEATSFDEFKAWKIATEKMKKIDPISDRPERIKAFQYFFAGLK